MRFFGLPNIVVWYKHNTTSIAVATLCSVFSVFTEATVPPAIFEMKSITIPIPGGEGMPPVETEVLPGAEISQIVNMSLWLILMIFVITAGGKLDGPRLKTPTSICFNSR